MYKKVPRKVTGTPWQRTPDMPELIHRLLMRRGINSREEAEAFLYPTKELLRSPFDMENMRQAADEINAALNSGKCICVYGDYDVDGVCATSILIMYLKSRGADCFAYIPDRHSEGYGLNEAAMHTVAQQAQLMITVDCGISCCKEIEVAKSLGLGVVVTDHHSLGDMLPSCTIVNPHIGEYETALCGAGVAFKLVCALENGVTDTAMQYIDLAALATIADIVPLSHENRVIASLGLKAMNEKPRLGIRLLIECAHLNGKKIGSGTVGFQIGPRINASGRLGDAGRALMLLTADDENIAAPIAKELDTENARRQKEEKEIYAACREQMLSYDLLKHRIIVLKGVGWNPGIIGLAASKLVSDYHFPVILLADNGEGLCTGSCRSIPAVNMYETLCAAADLMTRFGGHHQAAGLAMETVHLDEFIERLDKYLWEHTQPDDYIPEVEYDFELALEETDIASVTLMEQLLQPTGMDNPNPVFLTTAEIESTRAVGSDKNHLQMSLLQGHTRMKGIAFGQGALAGDVAGTTRAMTYVPSLNCYKDSITLQCEVKQLLTPAPISVIDSFIDKFSWKIRAYLTDILYNYKLNTMRSFRKIGLEEVARQLTASPQGTLILVATLEGALNFRHFLEKYELENRIDALINSYPDDLTAPNTLCLCPAVRNTVETPAYRSVILWDAPQEAFNRIPEGELFSVGFTDRLSWTNRMPDIVFLRELILALRKCIRESTTVIGRTTFAQLQKEMNCDEIRLTAGLAVLSSLKLVQVDVMQNTIRLLESHKCDPAEDALFKRLQKITDYCK